MRQEIHWRVWLIRWAIWHYLMTLALRQMEKACLYCNGPKYWRYYYVAGRMRMHLDSLQKEYPE